MGGEAVGSPSPSPAVRETSGVASVSPAERPALPPRRRAPGPALLLPLGPLLAVLPLSCSPVSGSSGASGLDATPSSCPFRPTKPHAGRPARLELGGRARYLLFLCAPGCGPSHVPPYPRPPTHTPLPPPGSRDPSPPPCSPSCVPLAQSPLSSALSAGAFQPAVAPEFLCEDVPPAKHSQTSPQNPHRAAPSRAPNLMRRSTPSPPTLPSPHSAAPPPTGSFCSAAARPGLAPALRERSANRVLISAVAEPMS